jgi:flagellin
VPITIGSNIASLVAQRRVGQSSSALSKVYEQLSSGLRINRASDDAAGLAVSQNLNLQSRVFGRAILNATDGQSVLAIADATVGNLSDIVVRIRELSTQASNGSFSSKQRRSLDDEAQALAREFNRIRLSSSFDGLKLFDGSLGEGLRFQVGFGSEGSIGSTLGGALGTGGFQAASTSETVANLSGGSTAALGDINGDGILDLVFSITTFSGGQVRAKLGTGNGGFGASSIIADGLDSTQAIALGDVNGDGALDILTTGGTKSTVNLSLGGGQFSNFTNIDNGLTQSRSIALGDLNGDGFLDLVNAGQSGVAGAVTIQYGSGSGTFGAATSYSADTSISNSVSVRDLNNDGRLDIITSGSNGASGSATVRLGSTGGGFNAATTYSMDGTTSIDLDIGDLNGERNP